MNENSFVTSLLSSYPPGIRTDAANIDQLKKWLKRKSFSEEDMEAALDKCRENFRMFPSIADLTSLFIQVRSKRLVSLGTEKAREYFSINGYQYCRDLEISVSGEVIRKPLPEDAENYFLSLPDCLRTKERFINAEEAYREGIIDRKFHELINPIEAKRDSRFKKIREDIKAETEDDFIDDSMAANYEEPLDIIHDRQFWIDDI